MNPVLRANGEINAIIPCYTPTGDHTKLYAADRRNIVRALKAKTVVQKLANRQTVDLRRLKSMTAAITKSTIWQPLVLAPDLVLVPLKVRKPKISGDATGGYFNFCQISSTRALSKSTVVQFKNGEEISVLWKQSTVESHLQRAHLASLSQGGQLLLLEKLAQFFVMHSLSGIQRSSL